MKTKLYAIALTAALVLGTSAVAVAQGSPPVGDPTAKTPTTPKQKVDSGVEPNGKGGKTSTTTGAGTASDAGGPAPSGAGSTK